MRLLIIVPHGDGAIRQAEVHDVQNEATWEADGGLLLQDGRLHIYPPSTRLYDMATPICQDVLAWGRDGKYLIDAAGDLCLVDGWTPPIAPEMEG